MDNHVSIESGSIKRRVARQLKLDYLRSLPSTYGHDPAQKWPLILFLHGAGERGSDLELVKVHGIPKIVEKKDLPFVTLSPQCPEHHWWSDYLPVLDALLEETIANLFIDPQRVYLTGLSMGGYGSWHMAVEYPRRFAALAPICGGDSWMYGVSERLEAIRNIPTWVFHGALDPVVPPAESQHMVETLRACGGNVRFTMYPKADHDSWTATYRNPKLYEWFLAQRRAE